LPRDRPSPDTNGLELQKLPEPSTVADLDPQGQYLLQITPGHVIAAYAGCFFEVAAVDKDGKVPGVGTFKELFFPGEEQKIYRGRKVSTKYFNPIDFGIIDTKFK